MSHACAGGPHPPPPAPVAAPSAAAPDAVAAAPDDVATDVTSRVEASEDALYLYRFRQTDPGSDRFTFQDRDLSFYFRPTPAALNFQVENRQGQPVWIDWERSLFVDWQGRFLNVAHRGSTWQTRSSVPAPTQIPGFERYSDYVFPLELLVDPGASDDQVHRRLFPEHAAAPQFIERTFGVDLVFRVEDKPRTYSFRFKVASVVPR